MKMTIMTRKNKGDKDGKDDKNNKDKINVKVVDDNINRDKCLCHLIDYLFLIF